MLPCLLLKLKSRLKRKMKKSDFWNRLRNNTSIAYNSFESYVNCDDIEFVDDFLSDQVIIQEVYAKGTEVDED